MVSDFGAMLKYIIIVFNNLQGVMSDEKPVDFIDE